MFLLSLWQGGDVQPGGTGCPCLCVAEAHRLGHRPAHLNPSVVLLFLSVDVSGTVLQLQMSVHLCMTYRS